MGYLTRYNPINELDKWFDLDKTWPWFDYDSVKPTLSNITKDEKAVYLTLSVPGFTRDELHISVENNTLTVSGEIKSDDSSKQRGYFSQAFTRSWTLYDAHDKKNISSKLENGILFITIPFIEKKADDKTLIPIQ